MRFKIDTLFEHRGVNQYLPSRSSEEIAKIKGMLNSERIEFLFDHYGLELLLQDERNRVSNLHSKGVMRTLAVVHFVFPVAIWLTGTHDKIYNGASIGQTIKEDGFGLTKVDEYFGVNELPGFAKQRMKTDESFAAVHMYHLLVNHPETKESFVYCSITEIHSPLYLTLGDLHKLYPEGTKNYNDFTLAAQKSFENLKKLDGECQLSIS